MPHFKNVSFDISPGSADVSSRATGKWRSKLPTLREMTVEGDMNYPAGTDDAAGKAAFTALRNACLNGTTIDIWVVDGPNNVSGNEGPRAECIVEGFGRDEPLEEGMSVPITLSGSTMNGNNPEWKTVP
jgi:hypothetical protein